MITTKTEKPAISSTTYKCQLAVRSTASRGAGGGGGEGRGGEGLGIPILDLSEMIVVTFRG